MYRDATIWMRRKREKFESLQADCDAIVRESSAADAKKQLVVSLRRSGMQVSAIAEQLGYSIRFTYAILAKYRANTVVTDSSNGTGTVTRRDDPAIKRVINPQESGASAIDADDDVR